MLPYLHLSFNHVLWMWNWTDIECTFLFLKSIFFYFVLVCQLVEKDVMGVMGFGLDSMDSVVASTLNYIGVPFIQVNPSFLWSIQKTKYGTSVNLFPDRTVLSQARWVPSFVERFTNILLAHSNLESHYFPLQALIDLMTDLKMHSTAILYDQETDILLWRNYLEAELWQKVIPPAISRLPANLSDSKSSM